MKICWIRGYEKLNFKDPLVFFVLGHKGAGKSSLLEHIAEHYLGEGAAVFDMFGSKDGEGLAFLRSPWAKEKRILLLRGDGVDVQAPYDVKLADTLTLHDFEVYDIIISANPLYYDTHQEFTAVAKITDQLYQRRHYNRTIYIICREAANLYYSRLKVSENQTLAKAEMTYLIRESRHMGLAIGLDSLRFQSIDVDIRSLSDFIFLKSVGIIGLPKELRWIYSRIDVEALRYLPRRYFVILSRSENIGIGKFPEVLWHKQEGEDILKIVGITVERADEKPHEGLDRHTFKTVGDKEHAEIIRMYVVDELSTNKIAEAKDRSPRTVHEHLKKHDEAIRRSGFCPKCRRAQSNLASVYALDKELNKQTPSSIYTLQQQPRQYSV